MLTELFGTLTTKVAAASFVAVTTVGTGAAAATGNLPGDLQDQAAEAVDGLGIDLPDSSEADAQNTERQDDANRQDDGRQDDENRQDENQDGEGTDTDDAVLDTLGDGVAPTDDGSEFGNNVSDNAENGDLGDEVSDTATDGNDGATTGDDASTTGDDAATTGDDAAADESDASEGDYPDDAPSDSGEQDNAGSDAESNPGDEYRSE